MVTDTALHIIDLIHLGEFSIEEIGVYRPWHCEYVLNGLKIRAAFKTEFGRDEHIRELKTIGIKVKTSVDS